MVDPPVRSGKDPLLWTASVGVLLVVVSFGWLSWTTLRSYDFVAQQLPALTRLGALRVQILLFDEVLTMTARMSAATGDPQWEARYRQFEPQLDQAMQDAIGLAPEVASSQAVGQADAANTALVVMENRTFDEVRQGRLVEAQQLLSSDEYQSQKTAYAAGVAALSGLLEQAIDSTQAGQLALQRRSAVILIVSVPFLLLASLFVLQAARRGHVAHSTERSQAEKRLQLQGAALNAAGDSMFITGRDGTIESVNQAFTDKTGYTPEEVIGKTPRVLKSGVHDQALYKDLWDTILAGRSWRGELTDRKRDGSLFVEDVAITPVKDADGEITHFISISRDLTETKQLEAQFRQAQKMESVGQLAGGIAHDFNNLLTIISGTAELLLEPLESGDPRRTDVEEIRDAGERAAALTRQLLAFSRKQIAHRQVLSLTTIVANMEPMLRRVIGENIDLAVTPTRGPDSVKVDPGQMEQVLANLVVNARDAMPQGGHLTIETGDVELDGSYAREHAHAVRPGHYVMLVVSDSGAGMDEITRGRIFEPFFTTKGPSAGTGLGLSTVFGIVKQNDGHIEVYSEIDRGTTFKIYLPQAVDEEDRTPSSPGGPASGTETILLVEDVDGLRHLARRMLESAGYTVLAAASGEEAMLVLERHRAPVSLVVTDIVMTGMSGLDLAQWCERTHPGVRVLYMSGYTNDVVVRHGVLEGGMPFLSKPFTAADLTRKAREVLDSQGSGRHRGG